MGLQRPRITGQGAVRELQCEEEEAGGLWAEAAADGTGDDFSEGSLDGVAVGEVGQVKDGRPGFPSAWAGRTASGMVVEAELLVAESGRATAVAVSVEVMADGSGGDS